MSTNTLPGNSAGLARSNRTGMSLDFIREREQKQEAEGGWNCEMEKMIRHSKTAPGI